MSSVLQRLQGFIKHSSYTVRWSIVGVLLGLIAGAGAVLFYSVLQLATSLFLSHLAGYHVPTPAGEGGSHGSAGFAHPLLIPLIVGIGGALAGLIVFTFAPDAEGHGTDAAIKAALQEPFSIKIKTIIVKIIASGLTIGSGGSGGREGPSGQISAGFGSLLARVLKLSDGDAKTAVSVGVGSGIGAIFGSPFGGAVLGCEILYREDFDLAPLVPGLIASFIAYAVFAGFEGFSPLFGVVRPYQMHSVWIIFAFIVLGAICAGFGILYQKTFYGLQAAFHRLPLPRWTKPALAGLVVGGIGLAVPEVLGTGYGWIQRLFTSQISTIPLVIIILVPFLRILATGLSIGSGGSGGIFGPGMVIGAFVGGAFWRVLHPLIPALGHDPAPFVIAAMMACFGSIARVPIAVTLMVAEMTGSIEVVIPALAAIATATLLIYRYGGSIYMNQVKNRASLEQGES
jgi:CIC family chloride channel protein